MDTICTFLKPPVLVYACIVWTYHVYMLHFHSLAERMWQELGSTPVELASSDQTRFGSILFQYNLTWTPIDYEANRYLLGEPQNKHITVIALPQEVVCRNQCNVTRLSSYYAYHPMTTHHVRVKYDVMMAQKVWRISNHWNLTLKTDQSTMDWLNEVTV